MSSITYRQGGELDLDQVIELFRSSTLGERRPIEKRDVMQGMIENADLIVTAWEADRLVGISRTLTDFWNVAYLADLAVDQAYQKRGIGTELVERTRKALKPTCSIVLLSAPKANEYYPKIGFQPNPRAWTLDPE